MKRPLRRAPIRSAYRVKTVPVALSALSALLGPAVLPVAAQAAPALTWRACPSGQGPARMECTAIEVPADWSAPGKATIKLDLARLPATDPSLRLGSVLVVPDGGPGIQGVLSSAPESFTKLRRHFDVVSYNPRTSVAGRYLPPSCGVPGLPLNDPRDRAAYEAQAAGLERLVDRCRQDDTTGLADHLDSDSVARDMEEIRIALGQDRLTMLAFSYGGVPAAGLVRLGYEALVSDRRYSERISRDFGGGVGIGLEALACSGWRHRPVNPPRPLPVGLPPVLGLGGDRDFSVTTPGEQDPRLGRRPL